MRWIHPGSVRLAVRAPLVLALAAAVTCAVLVADLATPERQQLLSFLTAERLALGILLVVPAWAGWVLQRYLEAERLRLSLAQATEIVQEAAHGEGTRRLDAQILPPAWARLIAAINDLAHRNALLRGDRDQILQTAQAAAELENSRLAGLLRQLDQAIIVCNADGNIVLYNAAASALFPTAVPPLGLGRPVHDFIDRRLISHALEKLRSPGATDAGARTQLLAGTSDGRRLRLRIALLASPHDGASLGQAMLLMADDVTQALRHDGRSLALFRELMAMSRSSLANIESAAAGISPDDASAAQATLVHTEAQRLAEQIDIVNRDVTGRVHRNWPLEAVRAADLRHLAARRLGQIVGVRVLDAGGEDAAWFQVDSFTLLEAAAMLAQRLHEEYGVDTLRVATRDGGAGAHSLDIGWQGVPMSTETAFTWQTDAFTLGGEDHPLSLAQVMERHAGRAWYERHAPTQTNWFRLAPGEPGDTAKGGPSSVRLPGNHDFSLLDWFAPARWSDEYRLDELALTAFDTETTGLDPNGGDEIIWLAGVRIVRGRLLESECFDTMIDPGREVPAAATRFHGIHSAQLAGWPGIGEALPRFWHFAGNSVLLGHNVAFDLRFLALKEAATGLRFDQPWLDTLQLAAVVFPSEPSQALETVAQRLGIEPGRRHSAWEDALTTARIYLRLVPLLAAMGIHTLGEARAASQATRYARLTYN